MKKLSIYFFLYFWACMPNIAQKLTPLVEACPSQIIPFNAPTGLPAGTQYDWDFCTGDLFQTPQASLVSPFINDETTPIFDAHRTESFDIVYDGSKWVGLMPSAGSNIIMRMDFPDGLEGLPVYRNIGNPSNALSAPRAVRIIKKNGEWFAFIANANTLPNTSRVALLRFGTSLTNTPTGIAFNVAGMGTAPQGVDIIFENDHVYAIVPSVPATGPSRKIITVLDFGTDLNIDSCTELFTIDTGISGSEKKIKHIIHNNNIYVFLAGSLDTVNGVIMMNFGNTITNSSPVITLLGSYVGGRNITGVEPVIEGSKCLLLALAQTGEIFRFDFGNSYNNTPVIFNFGNFGLMGTLQQANRPTQYSTLIRKDSKFYFFGVNRLLNEGNENQLVKLTFPNLCNAVPSTASTKDSETAYFETGVKDINLMVYETDGNLLYTYSDNLLIKDVMVSSFSYDGLCLGTPTIFSNLSRGPETQVTGWEWTLGNGQTSNNKDISYTYPQAGKYDVVLKVNNLSGCTNEIKKTIRISSKPTADFKITNIDCTNRTVTFEDLSDLTPLDKSLGGQIINRMWLFGDGTRWIASPITATSYIKTYNTSEVFTVTLSVTDDAGCTASVTKQISLLENATPIANFLNTTSCVDVPIQFTDSSTLPVGAMGELTDWQWTFYQPNGVNILATSTLKNPSYSYLNAGNYPVKLQVRNTLGCTHQITKTIQVLASPNSLYSTSKLTGPAPLTIQFNNLTSGATSFLWNFGTGEVSTTASPAYTFKNNGTYTVSFQAKNAQGCGKIVTFLVVVEQPTAQEPTLPTYTFKVYPNPTHKNLFIEFEGVPTEAAYQFTDLTGRIVLQNTLFLQKNVINTSVLSAGTYILHIQDKQRTWRMKIVKI